MFLIHRKKENCVLQNKIFITFKFEYKTVKCNEILFVIKNVIVLYKNKSK